MSVGGLPLVLCDAQRSVLEAAYAQPPRAYHDFHHVGEVLRHYDEVAAGPGWTQPREVALAVLYHDAIYQPGSSDNESRSARFAVGSGQCLAIHDGLCPASAQASMP